MTTWTILAAIALGLGAGLLSGMLGVGGGILFVPTLVLLRGKTVVDRLDGRATGKQISRMISPHVVAR